jgi:hypothetical protein
MCYEIVKVLRRNVEKKGRSRNYRMQAVKKWNKVIGKKEQKV